MHSLANPLFLGSLNGDRDSINALNAMEPSAGEYMRTALDMVIDIMASGAIDTEECGSITDAYNSVIMRFFEGDVPMMIATGDVVSGTKKRESQSETFTASPFSYSFHILPVTEQGGYFLNTTSLCFSVNRNAPDLDIANEFTRFLTRTDELNNIAKLKRLVAVTNEMPLDSVYASLDEFPNENIIYRQEIGVLDNPTIQLRGAVYNIANGRMTVDEAISHFGDFDLDGNF